MLSSSRYLYNSIVRLSGPGALFVFDERKASCTSSIVMDPILIGGCVFTTSLLSTLSGGRCWIHTQCRSKYSASASAFLSSGTDWQ